jgi:hypothetical protein
VSGSGGGWRKEFEWWRVAKVSGGSECRVVVTKLRCVDSPLLLQEPKLAHIIRHGPQPRLDHSSIIQDRTLDFSAFSSVVRSTAMAAALAFATTSKVPMVSRINSGSVVSVGISAVMSATLAPTCPCAVGGEGANERVGR